MRASANPSASRPVTTVVTGTVDKTELSPADIVAGDKEIVRNATEPARPNDKQLTWFRVTKGGYVGIDGLRARIPEGKELHDGAFNIQNLRKQGIILAELGHGPATGYVEPGALAGA